MQSLIIAFAMYSRLPMPKADWNDQNMKYALGWFPAVGAGLGLLIWIAFLILDKLGLGSLAKAAVLTALPLVYTGGIHLDGFMDTSDALASWGDRTKKLEILKDSHIGAFAVIRCGIYLVLTLGFWSEATGRVLLTMCGAFVLERVFSAYLAAHLPNARGSGMLASFTGPLQMRIFHYLLAVLGLLSLIFMGLIWLPGMLLALVAACGTALYYKQLAMKYFGGVTGDLAGWFLQLCELVMLIVLVIGDHLIA